jgi:hypothetical protein
MIINTMRRGKAMGSRNNSVVFIKYIFEVRMHKWCLNCMNGIELGNNDTMDFFEDIFHSMGIDDLRGA